MRTGKTVLNDLDCLPSAPSFAFAKLFLRELPRMYFTAVLLMQNCKRTENEIKSVRPKFARSPFPPCLGGTPKNPGSVQRRGYFIQIFLCAFAVQTQVGGDSIESSKGYSPPPNQNCKRTEDRIISAKSIFTVRR